MKNEIYVHLIQELKHMTENRIHSKFVMIWAIFA